MKLNQSLYQKLQEATDETYKEFHTSLVPGLTNMLGVRMPKIRQLTKWAAKQNWEASWEELSKGSYEELMIKGLLIGYGKLTLEEQTHYLQRYVPEINNWGICDCCCSTWKFMKKDQAYWFEFLQSYLKSENEFEVRFAIVSLLDHFINEIYLDKLFQIFDKVKHDGYYVKMAVAWGVSVCFVKYPERTMMLIEKGSLDAFTHNKSIQKICESLRVSEETKNNLK